MENKEHHGFMEILKKIVICSVTIGGISLVSFNLNVDGLFQKAKNFIAGEETTGLGAEVPNTTEIVTEATTEAMEKPEESSDSANSFTININSVPIDDDNKDIPQNSTHIGSISSVDKSTEKDSSTTKSSKKSEQEKKDSSSAELEDSDVTNQASEEEESIDNMEDDGEQPTKMACKINIDSPGQLYFVSRGEIDQKGSVSILYNEDNSESEKMAEEDGTLCDLADIINEDDSSGGENIKYVDVVPGVYTFDFIDCDVDNIDVYFTDDIEELVNSESTDENEEELGEECLMIPSQNITKVSLYETEHPYIIVISPEYDFVPVIQFYSENGIAGMLRIMDESGEELEIMELDDSDDEDIQEIEGSFMFEEGKKYYIDIASFTQKEALDEYIYYFQISETYEEEPITEEKS